jgi:hypothetical protein
MYNESMAAQPTREPAVLVQIGIAAKTAEELYNVVEALEKRLMFVMREPEPASDSGAIPVPIEPVPLVAKISSINREFDSSIDRLNEIMRRLEI